LVLVHAHLRCCLSSSGSIFHSISHFASPVGAYYSTGFKPVKLLADTRYVRAWPGGTGDTKCGGNYAATIKPQAEAAGMVNTPSFEKSGVLMIG
jgi:branched-subunit amino acid aminotransferase/4-amino-4-deoxychorismate lyase